MNERIKELAEQATTKISFRIDPNTYKHIDDPTGPHVRLEFSKEKFAELLIRECAEIADLADENKCEWIGGNILTHFGVE
jgi:hypothetical protein